MAGRQAGMAGSTLQKCVILVKNSMEWEEGWGRTPQSPRRLVVGSWNVAIIVLEVGLGFSMRSPGAELEDRACQTAQHGPASWAVLRPARHERGMVGWVA